MRKNPTKSETRTIDALKDLGEKEIITQVIIRYMIIDIALPKRNLLIEVDGSSHWSKRAQLKDSERDRILRSFGFNIVRIPNNKSWNKDLIETLIMQFPITSTSEKQYLIAHKRAKKNKPIRDITAQP